MNLFFFSVTRNSRSVCISECELHLLKSTPQGGLLLWRTYRLDSDVLSLPALHGKVLNSTYNIHFLFFSFLKKYIYWLCYYSCPISPPTPLHPAHPSLPHPPPHSSCPWVIPISSLASTFPTLFFSSPCLFSTYHLCYLFSVPFPPSPSHSPIDNLPCDLHLYGSIPVLVVCLVCSCFCFRCGC